MSGQNSNSSRHTVNASKPVLNGNERSPSHMPAHDASLKKGSQQSTGLAVPQYPPTHPPRAAQVVDDASLITLDEGESEEDIVVGCLPSIPATRGNKPASSAIPSNSTVPSSTIDTTLQSGGIQCCEQNHKWLLLTPTQTYRIQSDPIGSFRIRGGHTGNMIIDRASVTIHDTQGALLFSQGSILDRVLVEDQVGGTSVVNFIPTGAGRTSEAVDQHKTIPTENSIQIIGIPGEPILISGTRKCVVQGDGGVLEIRGGAAVHATHCLDGVILSGGGGSLTVEESVNGDVSVTGTSQVEIMGDVVGQINLNGDGTVTVKGDVFGDITLNGGGIVRVNGSLKGQEHNHGSGQIIIDPAKV